MERMQEILSEVKLLSDKTARIETHIEYQREQLDKIERAITALEPIKVKVESHEVKIRGFSWIFGLIVSLISAKVFGKF